MFRLTRQVRFAINRLPDDQRQSAPTNSYAGYPTLMGIGAYLSLDVTLSGQLDPRTSYLRNIKEIDDVVRRKAIPLVSQDLDGAFDLPHKLFDLLRDSWPGTTLQSLRLNLSPFLSVACHASEYPMIRLSQKFEFSACHRLFNPAFSDEENVRFFGKCSNPHGHGHNYEVQVTVTTPSSTFSGGASPRFSGEASPSLRPFNVRELERIVTKTVIDPLDHKNLNVEVPEFKDLIPSVENIAKVIYRKLKPALPQADVKLSSVTVWETAKTWCEVGED